MLSPALVAITLGSSRSADWTPPPGASHCVWVFDTVSETASESDVERTGEATTSTCSDMDAIGRSIASVTLAPDPIVTMRSADRTHRDAAGPVRPERFAIDPAVTVGDPAGRRLALSHCGRAPARREEEPSAWVETVVSSALGGRHRLRLCRERVERTTDSMNAAIRRANIRL